MRSICTLLIIAVVASGCAEYVSIKSYPAGAQAYVDGVSIGSTPAETSIPRSQVGTEVDAVLTGGDCEGPARARPAAAPPQPGIMIQNIVGDRNQATTITGPEISKTQRLHERLTTLRDL
jgi:hypothetical protein